jgi:prolyl 4-hydroxylase
MAEDGDALFAAAAARLAGEGAERDLAAARALFARAAEAGKAEAAVIFVNLLAAGVGGPRNWPAALTMLRRLAGASRRSREQLELVSQMELTGEGDPVSLPEAEVLAPSPDVRLIRGLFSGAECRYLAEAARPMLQPSVVVDRATGRQTRDPVRTSDGMGFTWPLENPAVHALNRRIAAATGTSPEQGEALQVLRYAPGEQYRTHFDAIPGFANQRVMTVIVWLNEDYEGGETDFPAARLKVKGRAGDALVFRNVGADGRPDPASAHAGLSVTRGEKLIASRWIRERAWEPPVGGLAG